MGSLKHRKLVSLQNSFEDSTNSNVATTSWPRASHCTVASKPDGPEWAQEAYT